MMILMCSFQLRDSEIPQARGVKQLAQRLMYSTVSAIYTGGVELGCSPGYDTSHSSSFLPVSPSSLLDPEIQSCVQIHPYSEQIMNHKIPFDHSVLV